MQSKTFSETLVGSDSGLPEPLNNEAVDAGSPDTGPALPRMAGIGAAALATAACGGGGEQTPPTAGAPPVVGAPPAPEVLAPQNDAEASRFLLQAGFASSAPAIAQVSDQGYEAWLDSQMSVPSDGTAYDFFESRGYNEVDSNRYYNITRVADYMVWSQLMSGNNSLRKRFALALSEFFVVSLNGINQVWRSQAIGAYWDLLNQHAFGNFRDLIEDITLNPAMGTFLNTRGNQKADPSTGRVPDENYGREIMQLYSIGLFELQLDGTQRLSGGEPIETYTNEDVTGIAKVFTGYDFDYTDIGFTTEVGGTRQIPDAEYAFKPMTADASRWRFPRNQDFHSSEEKSFLGLTIPAGTNASDSLTLALDHVFNHANVAPFFSKQMIQRLVTSNPSPAYVQRVASVFENNGSGTRGDLGAVYKAILLDDEALDPSGVTNPGFGKLREPILRFVQLGRTFGMRSISGNWAIPDLADTASELGQSPLRSPSVFNFFRPTYFPTNSVTSDNNLLAPEFQIVDETSVAGYINLMERAVNTTTFNFSDVELDYSEEVAIADDSLALVDRLDLLLTADQLSADVRNTIQSAIDSVAIGNDDDRLRRVHIGVLLTMASTDYLIQK